MVKNNKIRLGAVLFVLVMIIQLTVSVFAYPAPTDLVYDGAGVLSESTIRLVKKTNEDLKNGTCVAVCTVNTTGEESIDKYALGLFNEWGIKNGVLVLVATDDNNYYLKQSDSIVSKLTAADLQAVRDGYLEPDYATGNIDSAVSKTIAKLAIDLTDKVPDIKEETTAPETTGNSFGKVIGGIFKAILIIVLVAVILFVILFVVGMFNDDVALFLRKNIFDRFRKNGNSRKQSVDDDYDERLDGSRTGSQQNVRRPQNPNGQHRPQNRNYQNRNGNRNNNSGNGRYY